MNCAQGDMAVVIRSRAGEQVGRIVRCVEAVTFNFRNLGHQPAWITDPMLHNGRHPVPCPDAWLRPIRPGPIADEEVRDLYAPTLPARAKERA